MIYRTKSRLDAARFVRSLTERGFQQVPPSCRMVRPETFRTRTYPNGAFGVIYNDSPAWCSTPGHGHKPVAARGICSSCMERDRYKKNAAYRERQKAYEREKYARMTPEQRDELYRRQRVNRKLRRWAA